MNNESKADASGSDERQVGLHITSDPDRTEVEQPDTSGAREGPSLPFRVLLVSDLTAEASPEDWSAERHVHRVDTNRFTDVMAEMAPQLSMEVRNTLADTPQTWEVELSFPGLGAFRPDQAGVPRPSGEADGAAPGRS